MVALAVAQPAGALLPATGSSQVAPCDTRSFGNTFRHFRPPVDFITCESAVALGNPIGRLPAPCRRAA
jgi:hypothetical protein